MNSYRVKIDEANDWRELQLVLDEMEGELATMLESPFIEEESYRQKAHDLELIVQYGRLKLDKMLS